MRVLVPYISLHPDTYRVLRGWPDVEFCPVGDSDTAYADLLKAAWRDGRHFVVIEQDIVPHSEVLYELVHCQEPYCAFPYEWKTNTGPALGCTRFRHELLAAHPNAMDEAAAIPSPWGKPGHWKSLDVALMRNVLRDKHGLQPHIHLPSVEHRNPDRVLLPEYADRGVDTQVLGRSL